MRYAFASLLKALAATGALIAGVNLAASSPGFRGPVEATVLEVLDGDTFLAAAHVWPGQAIEVNVRIRGIDAPEMKSRCAAEHEAALLARDVLAALVGRTVFISNIGGAKYYGRVLADVETAVGDKVAEVLLAEKLVRGKGKGRSMRERPSVFPSMARLRASTRRSSTALFAP